MWTLDTESEAEGNVLGVGVPEDLLGWVPPQVGRDESKVSGANSSPSGGEGLPTVLVRSVPWQLSSQQVECF